MYFYKYFGATHLYKKQLSYNIIVPAELRNICNSRAARYLYQQSFEIVAAAELRNICRNGSKNDQKVQRTGIYI
jgi:hypothetical protein